MACRDEVNVLRSGKYGWFDSNEFGWIGVFRGDNDDLIRRWRAIVSTEDGELGCVIANDPVLNCNVTSVI
jgi:hypothetical protein